MRFSLPLTVSCSEERSYRQHRASGSQARPGEIEAQIRQAHAIQLDPCAFAGPPWML